MRRHSSIAVVALVLGHRRRGTDDDRRARAGSAAAPPADVEARLSRHGKVAKTQHPFMAIP